MHYFNDDADYPFVFYCNGSGEIFLPFPEENDLEDLTQLPYPLQGLYERYWSEHYRWMAYLVRHGDTYGLMLEQEFSVDSDIPDYEEQMNALFQKVIGFGANVEHALSIFCPKAEVHLGHMSGCDECHELCVFIPSTASGREIQDALYLLDYADTHDVLPYGKSQLYTEEYQAFLKKHLNFSAACGIAPGYDNKPTVSIGFADGDDVFSVRVVTDQVDEKTPARLETAIRNVRHAARQFNETPDAETIVIRACNALFPCAWEFIVTKHMFVLDVRQDAVCCDNGGEQTGRM